MGQFSRMDTGSERRTQSSETLLIGRRKDCSPELFVGFESMDASKCHYDLKVSAVQLYRESRQTFLTAEQRG